MPFYAVARGRQPGIFETWSKCERQVKGFKDAKFKKFSSKGEAEKFVESNGFYGNSSDNKSKDSKKTLVKNMAKIHKSKIKKIKIEENVDLASDCDDEEEKFLVLPEYSDESIEQEQPSKSTNTAKEPKRKDPRSIKFDPPEPTTEKIYDGHKFQEDSKGFVHVYTDGSCIGNGKSIASAGLGVYFGEDNKLNVSEPVTGRATNNVGEIQAAIKAILTAQSCSIKRLCIFTDSQFLINSICIWMPEWKRKNWKLARGKPVKNEIDFKRLDELIESGNMLIKWSYIPAHKGYHGNEEADRLAKLGSERYQDPSHS